FLVRRMFVNIPTNQLNRLFLRLAHQLPDDVDYVSGVRSIMSEPSRYWPTDAEFRDGILRYSLFTGSRPGQRRLVLESLEESYGHKERPPFGDCTIEHIMPQTLTPAWREMLGPLADEIHASKLHVLGNLTLTAYNPELSNSPFETKRSLISNSNLVMNREIAEQTEWSETEIAERAHRLADKAIALWPGP
ncbi:MAG: HNH endonuclease family protein, partial [Chloroflexota bacterium]|nr:HNH endonuclease family protein [Chloroflexota bacterium]